MIPMLQLNIKVMIANTSRDIRGTNGFLLLNRVTAK